MLKRRNGIRRHPLLPEKHERVVAKKKPCCLRTECLLSAIVIGLLALFVTWGSSAIVNAGYDLVQARACLNRAEKDNEILRLELAQLKSPQRIREIAVNELGLRQPNAVYMAAAKPSESGGLAARNQDEYLAASRRTFLFGNSRAEAHNLR